MGFDKHFYEDHCYMDDAADGVGMNVEIIEDNNYQVAQTNITIENPILRYLDVSGSSNSKMNESYEDVNRLSKKALVYLPYSEYCTDHADMFLHEDEKLVKPGDKFNSHDDFIQYLNENAKRWCFYYRCSDSRKPNTEYETYTYNCVYLRNKKKYKKMGLRKRNNNMKTDCPCKIKLRHLPNEKELTVVYVCNHHDHDLTLEEFYKLQHGRRLPPYVREEIMDFLKLKVDIMKIRAYVEMETGFNMSRPFFYALEKNMKSRNMERQITEKRYAMLRAKIAAVEEMYGYQDEESTNDQSQHIIQDHADEIDPSKKIRRSLKDVERVGRTPPLKRRSKPSDEVTLSDNSKRLKTEANSEATYSNDETLQSVKNLQESAKCEIQENPWVTDQCVPVLPNRTARKSVCEAAVQVQAVEHLQDDIHSVEQNELEPYSYIIEYLNPDDANNHEISNECTEIIDDGQVNDIEEHGMNDIAYETVVTDDINEIQSEVQEYVNHDHIIQEGIEIHIDSQDNVTEQSDVLNDFDNTQDVSEVENGVEYVTEDMGSNDNVVEYVEELNEVTGAQDVGVQTANGESSAHSLLPVFDVYMKDGNVTGFVVNDNLISGMKDGVDKEIQTTEDLILSDTQDSETEDFDFEIIHDTTNSKSGDTYTKHEYVHKYNIDKYMVQPHFPKYIETLAKETYMDVLHMFTNIYNEKAMFKITTTQKGKEGNTRIWYIKDTISKRQRRDEAHREHLGRNLQSVFILKDKLRTMKKRNNELMSKNKQLEEVALRLVDMT